MAEHEEQRERGLSRREVITRGAVGAGGVLGLSPLLAACGSSSKTSAAANTSKAGGSITIGSFQDNAMAPFRDVFIKRFTAETGIKVNYNETNYDSWYQNSKNDGLNKTGAYDIYVMDDNWVPEFAAGKIIQNLDDIGYKVNPDILPKGLDQGYWPPKTGPRLKEFASASPALYAVVIIDDVEILYYNKDYFSGTPKTWDDIYKVAKAKSKPPKLYGWSARGVKGNPIVQTYSFIPYMPAGVAEFDTDQETQVMLEGKCTALTEYTGLVHRVDDPSSSKVVGKIDMAATPKQETSGPAIGTFICGIASGAKNTQGAVQFLEWFTSSKVQTDFARQGGSAAVTNSALHDPQAVKKYRWLPAIADAVNNSVPKPRSPDEPKMEDILGTQLNEALVEAIGAKGGYTQIAQKHLTSAANQITSYLKQQGGYF